MNHPTPGILARNLRQMADRLDDTGTKAIHRAADIAARGYPAATNGSGSRSSDATSSTERSAIRGAPNDPRGRWRPEPFDGIDTRLARQLRLMWATIVQTHGTLDTIMAQASDDDPIRPGQGVCDRCGLVCKGTGSNRLHRSQLCHACNQAFRRWQGKNQGTKMDFLVATAGNDAYKNVRRRLELGA